MLSPLLIAVLAVCSTPAEPCACSPPTTRAVVYGRVINANSGAGVAGIRVEVELFEGACGGAVTQPTNVGQRFAYTDDQGRYRAQAQSLLGLAQPACAEASALVGADTLRGPRASVALRRSTPFDSVRVDIALP